MFQFSTFPTLTGRWEINPIRFPYLGNLRIKAHLAAPRSFSQLCHDLHRLWTPRHPPYTLRSLTYALSCIVVAALFAYVLIKPDIPCFQRYTDCTARSQHYLYRFSWKPVSSVSLIRLGCFIQGCPLPTNGGGDRIRTDDPLVANQVLYQLSYAPFCPLATAKLLT